MKSSIKTSHVIGIDLGTTNTVVAYLDETGKPKIIPNCDGELKLPSVVFVGPGAKEILVGAAAMNMSVVEPRRVITEFKRDVGTDKVYFTEATIQITPAWCQTQILRAARQSAVDFFGDLEAGRRAVVTVPAYFGEKERQSVKHSAEAAGIQVLKLINEPTAAGLAYGIKAEDKDQLVMIPDFGGGTFDASLVNYQAGEATVLASNGDKHLGGKDVDAGLTKLVCEQFEKQHGLKLTPDTHPADWFAIRDEVIRQKHMLASRTEVKITARADGKSVVVPVDRVLLKQVIQSLLTKIETVIRETLVNGKVAQKDVKWVLRVGGSSRLVAFDELIKSFFGENCLIGGQVSPDLAVAEGAAILAAKEIQSNGHRLVDESLQAIPVPRLKHNDVMAHSLGVAVQSRASDASCCSVILERNQPIPCQAVKKYAAVDDRQTSFHVAVLQGEDGELSDKCLVVGERDLELPARDSGKPSFEVSMGYDASGLVKVCVHDLISGKQEDITLDFYAKSRN